MFIQATHNNILIITFEIAIFDAKAASAFKERVAELFAQNERNCVVLDLHKVHSIDSSGLGAFLFLLRMIHLRRGELKLAGVNKPVHTTLELLSMHKIFAIFDSLEDAMRSFQPLTLGS